MYGEMGIEEMVTGHEGKNMGSSLLVLGGLKML
jgi:hypothetical protein